MTSPFFGDLVLSSGPKMLLLMKTMVQEWTVITELIITQILAKCVTNYTKRPKNRFSQNL